MKTLYLILASLRLSLAAPAALGEDDLACACPMPLCPPGQPERCKCQNAAIASCWADQIQQGKALVCPAPALRDCDSASGLASVSTSTLPTSAGKPTSAFPTALPAEPSASCTCEPTFCAQIWPQSCRCANSGKVLCHQRCGGVAPRLQNCGDSPEESASLYGTLHTPRPTEPFLPTEPGPVIVSLPAVNSTSVSNLEDFPQITDVPTPLPSDLEQFPRFNDRREEFDAPTSVSDVDDFPQMTPIGVPPDTSVPQCNCAPVFCAQSWPLSCQCSNQAASDCALTCGRPLPTFLDCDGTDPEDLDAQLPDLFDMVPEPSDIPVIFTNLISDLPDPQELPAYLENLPDYVNDLIDDEPWSETHTWFSFYAPATSLVGDLLSGVLPTSTDGIPESASLPGFTEVSATFSSEEIAGAEPSITEPATANYHVCGHRGAQSCPTGYDCLQRPNAHCGPDSDCGGYCVDVLNSVTLLADTTTQTSPSTPSNTLTLDFSSSLRTSTTRGLNRHPPRQVNVNTALIPGVIATSPVQPTSTSLSVFPQIRCGDGYPACDPGLECVDILISGIGFAEKRSYCAAVADASGSSSLSSSPSLALDLFATSISSLNLDNIIPTTTATPSSSSSPTHPYWPDPAWSGPITTLRPMFGPGPVGLSLLPNFRPSSTPAAIQALKEQQEQERQQRQQQEQQQEEEEEEEQAQAQTQQPTFPTALTIGPLPRQIIGPIVPPPAGPHPVGPSPSSSPSSSSPSSPSSAPPPPSEPQTMRCGGPDPAADPDSSPCPSGFTCVRDLSPDAERPNGGCGPACGEYGVCIVPQGCGGFAATPCAEEGRECVDDPSDGCDPSDGGADCMGVCV
ncbi:uncharacterized protein BKCO1_100013 [Diplodia corticola]|uniref:Uncharacterized protein n=1 Tax=Diplodia corticola TaxID=236234 RepID=A0A1J9RIR1_9PEZI|nr:uncharacterized protein BKCO1_100013 [Diplodia corticola]OJD40353.1 hypothetical protein BKCO1_100013 [Diplodia corticola]